MAEETAVLAESSAAAAVAEPKFTQFDGWDEEGTPVVHKKETKPEEADAAAADTSKETTKAEDGADSAAKKTQETHRKPNAEARIKELAAANKKLLQELEDVRKPKETKADSSTAKAAEQTPAKAAEVAPTRPKPIPTEKGADGKPKYATYWAFEEDLIDWKTEQREAKQQREQQVTQQQQTMSKKLEEARGRYTDFDPVTKPLIQDLMKPDVPRQVMDVLNDSPVLPDLLYTIGGTEASKTDFLEACRTNPAKALRVALLIEQEIVKELGKAPVAAKKDSEAETAAAAPKPRAPKPPTEVGGRGAPGEDALLSAAKTGDFRTFDAEQTRRALASRR